MRILTENWPRKLISLIAAILIWAIVSHSISLTRVLSPVAVTVVNAPPGYIFAGIQQNGVFDRTLSISVSGDKAAIESLRPGDLSLVLDASDQTTEWVAQLSSADLRSTRPEISLGRRLQLVSPREVIVKMSPVVSERVPVFFTEPVGEPPAGYQCLDVFPRKLYVSLSGPEDQIKRVKAQGLALTLDLGTISKEELEWLEQQIGSGKDEISLPIPGRWLRVRVPFSNEMVTIDDPEAAHARILFVREQLLPLNAPLPITVFYPVASLDTWNPEDNPLVIEGPLKRLHGQTVIDRPLYVSGVSRTFLDLLRGNLTLLITARPDPTTGHLPWGFQAMDLRTLENKFLKRVVAESPGPLPREESIRARFRAYLRKFEMLTGPDRIFRAQVTSAADGLHLKLEEALPQRD